MLSFLKKQQNPAVFGESSRKEAPSHTNFIPYFHHYDRRTIATKNGELLQIIQITKNLQGLNYEGGANTGQSLRSVVRNAIRSSVKTDRFSFWIHTIRRRRPIHFEAHHQLPFARYVHEGWKKKHHQDYAYFNEVYLTVLHEGYPSDLFDAKHLQQVVLPSANRAFRNHQLELVHKHLSETTERILASINAQYNARILGIDERIDPEATPGVNQPVYFSEPIEFLNHLVNLEHRPCPLADMDIAQYINQSALTFGYNAMESRSSDGHKRYASVLTIKHYHETSPEILDIVLQASVEMIVSQSWNFIPAKEAAKYFKPQRELFEFSGDQYSLKATGIDVATPSKSASNTDYVKEQSSIVVITNEYKQLDDEIIRLQKMFGDVGITTIREDMLLEDVFWSQLPGNFEFIRRSEIVPASYVAGFARLNRFPTGNATGNHWHDALTVFPTQVGAPYFFNFHLHDRGHTLLIDHNSFHDSSARVLTNFLLTEATKWDCRIVVFDTKNSAQLLTSKLQGVYYPAHQAEPLKLNPFSLDDAPRNQSFLLAWLNELLGGKLQQNEAERNLCRDTISRLYTLSEPNRHPEEFVRLLEPEHPALARHISNALRQVPTCQFGRQDSEWHPTITGFNMDDPTASPEQQVPVLAYLLHRAISQLDGRPTILVVHDAINFFENPFFAPRLESLLEMLTQHNTILLASITNPDQYRESHTLKTLIESAATRIYLPDEIQQDYSTTNTGLTATDSASLARMKREKGHFMLKQGHDSVNLTLSLENMDDVRAIFANDIKNLIAAGGAYAATVKG